MTTDSLIKHAQDLAKHPQTPIASIPKRIAYVVSHGQSYASNGYAIRTQGVAQALNEHGFETLCFVRPGRPWELQAAQQDSVMPETMLNGVRYVHSRWPNDVSPKGDKNRLEASVEQFIELFSVYRPEVVLAASNYIVGLPAWVAAQRLGIPFYNEVRGFWELSRDARETGYADTPAFKQEAERDTFVAKQALKVFTLNQPMKEELAKRGVDPDKIDLVPNGVSELPEIKPADPALKKKLGIQSGDKVVGYVGSFNRYEGLDTLVEACTELVKQGEPIKLLLVGDDQPVTEVVAKSEMLADKPWLIQVGRVPHEEVGDYYALIDVVVIPRKKLPVCEIVPPMKLVEALAYGKRVVVSDVVPLIEYADRYGSMRSFQADSVTGLIIALQKTLKLPASRLNTELLFSAHTELMIKILKMGRSTTSQKEVLETLLTKPAASERENVKVMIVGSCVTRDPIEKMLGKEITLIDYVARCSLAAINSPPLINDALKSRIISPFQRRMVTFDMEKTWPSLIVEKEYDALLIDLIDERFDIAVYGHSLVTYSDEFKKGEGSFKPERLLSFDSKEKMRHWESGVEQLANVLNSLNRPIEVILNKVFWTLDTEDGDQLKHVSKSKVDKVNDILEKMYNHLLEKLPGLKVISYESCDLIVDKNHRWGVTPYYFGEKYESKFRELVTHVLRVKSSVLGLSVKGQSVAAYEKSLNESIGNDQKEFAKKGEKVQLSRMVAWQQFGLNGDNIIRIFGRVNIKNGGDKAGILLVELFDKKNKKISPSEVNLPKSDVFGGSFVYLQDTNSKKVQLAVINTAKNVAYAKIGFVLFQANNKTVVEVSQIDIKATKFAPQAAAASRSAEKPKQASDYKVAIIADEFTSNSFAGEFQAFPLEPDNWLDVFQGHQPDIFFCESAWAGPDPVRRPWRGKIYASINFPNENRKTLLSILEYCKKAGIPTVFWNKEDPTHHNDRVHDFVKTAALFDYVFTTAAECVESYKKNYGVKNAFALPFGTNPRLFNPVETVKRSNHVVFAGSWYENHTERCKEMRNILDRLVEGGSKLDIYNRYHGDSDPLHIWPEKYSAYLLPAKPHHEMPDVYKSSVYGLNFNTVTLSSTMFARRVFELMSSNTLVVSNYSQGVDEMFGNLVVFPDRDPERLKSLTQDEVDSIRYEALHDVLEKHTYKQRWRSILQAIGLPFVENDTTLTFTYIVKEREEALSAISWYQQYGMQFSGSRLLLVTDISMDPLDVAKFYQEFNRFGVSVTSMLHAEKYAMPDRYRPVETSHFVALHPGQNIDAEQIKMGVLHLQYMTENLVALAEQPEQRYRTSSATSDTVVMGSASQFINWLKSQNKQQPSTVYWV